MKKIFSLLLLSLISLSSCSYNGTSPLIRNGDYLFSDDLKFDDVARQGSYENIVTLLNSKETFLLYIKQDNCYGCETLSSILIPYLSKSKNLLYFFDAAKDGEEYSKLVNNYPNNFFFPPGTPALYLVNGNNTTQLSNSRMGTSTMFENYMKEIFFETNVYSMTQMDIVNKYIAKNDNTNLLFFNRNDDAACQMYTQQVKDIALQSENNLLIIETSLMNDENLNIVKNEYNISPSFGKQLVMFNINKDIKTSYEFSLNDIDDGKNFVSNYL